MEGNWRKNIRIRRDIKVLNPVLIASWPGVADVSLDAVTYLREKIGAEEFAEVELSEFFDFDGVFVKHGIVQSLRLPQNKFYHWRDKDTNKDLIIFEGKPQPATKSYEFARQILGFAHEYGVEQVYTLAAVFVDRFEQNPRVWVTATDTHLLEGMEEMGLVLKSDFHVNGMNGLLLSVAKEMGLKGICLLGETPHYLADIGDPSASKAVLEALTKVLGLEVEMDEFTERTKYARQTIAKLSRELQQAFIDSFIIPLWEQSEEDS